MIDVVEKLTRIADASKRADGSDIPLGEQCREAASEILRLRALTDWRPISTAPKDGTVILVSFGTIGVHAVSWTHDRKFAPYPLRGWHPEHSSAPTHWLPLPNAPEGDDDE